MLILKMEFFRIEMDKNDIEMTDLYFGNSK